MANNRNTPGRRGALPRDESRSYPVLEHFLRPWEGPVTGRYSAGVFTSGQLPPVPDHVDVDRASKVGDWPMYCNGPDPSAPPQIRATGVGNCTIAERCHSFAAQRVYAGRPEPQFSAEAVLERYSRWGGYVLGSAATDHGCDPTVVLQGCVTDGITDTDGYTHKLVAWAALGDPLNAQLTAQILSTFGTVAFSGRITSAQDDQFLHGQPWEYVQDSTDLGGHMFCQQRRSVGGTGINQVVTWGKLQRVTRRFMRMQIHEAYAVVSEDWIGANGTTVQGLDLGALLNFMPHVG